MHKPFLTTLCLLFMACSATPTSERPNIILVTTQRLVADKKKPILFVSHDKNGDWEFLTSNKGLDPAIRVAWNDMVALDSTLAPILNIKPGWIAWRKDVAAPWITEAYEP